MIVVFTDFGSTGPYTGQMHAVLHREAPGVPIVDLMCDAPSFNPRAAAYLLAALAPEFPSDAVFLCVIDPGVGDEQRRPVVLSADGRRFVGPDNGLFSVVAARAAEASWWQITLTPARLSHSFHGRDLFAPTAAVLARGDPIPGERLPSPLGTAHGSCAALPADLHEIVYIDHFGNAMTGMRASELPPAARLAVAGHELVRARTFSDVAAGAPFWYENSIGLAEIAVNRGSAAERLGLRVGQSVRWG